MNPLNWINMSLAALTWLLLGLLVFAFTGCQARADPNVPVAMYTGYGSETLDQLDGWTNRPVHQIMDYLFVADQGDWNNFEGSAWYWACSVGQPRTRQMVAAVGFFPAGAGATMAQAAAGAYDAHYANVASTLVGCGYGDSIVRVAWEFNCCYPWGEQQANDPNYTADYIQAFRRLVNQFRQYSPNFRFVWNPNGDYYQDQNYKDKFPGSYWVDIIGVDVYSRCGTYGGTTDPVQCFGSQVQIMLDDIASFDANLTQNGWCCFPKPLALPEWAAGDDPVGDNPYFMNKIADWVDANWVAPNPQGVGGFVGYWNGGNGSGYNGDLSLYPKQRGAWAARFGGVGQ